MRRAAVFIGAIALSGSQCGASPHRGEPVRGAPPHGKPFAPDDERAIADFAGLLLRADSRLELSMQTAATVDCAQVCDLAATICSLAAKICDIAARNPASREAAERCTDARARCARARERVAAKCRCGP